MRNRKQWILLSIIGLFFACRPPSIDHDAEAAALMQRSRDWSDLVSSAPIDEWIEYWAEDAVMMPPGLPPLEGRAAIREYVEAAAEIPGFSISWEPLSAYVAEGGDIAYMIERNVTTVSDSVGNLTTTHGKGVTIWRRAPDGSWRNVVDVWNAAPPPG